MSELRRFRNPARWEYGSVWWAFLVDLARVQADLIASEPEWATSTQPEWWARHRQCVLGLAS